MSSLNLDPVLQVVDQGTICRGQAGTDLAIYTYPNLTWLSTGVLVAMLRSGSGKDTSDESLYWFQSSDCGSTWVEKAFSAPRPSKPDRSHPQARRWRASNEHRNEQNLPRQIEVESASRVDGIE